MEDKDLPTKNQENDVFSLTKEKVKLLHKELSEIGHRKAYILNQLNNRENSIVPFLKDALDNQYVYVSQLNQKGILTNLRQDNYNKLVFNLTYPNLYLSRHEFIINNLTDFDLFLEDNFIILDINEFLELNNNIILQKEKDYLISKKNRIEFLASLKKND